MTDQPKSDCGSILIRRTSQYLNYLCAIDILVDGCKVGGVRNDKTEAFAVPPGIHALARRAIGAKPLPVSKLSQMYKGSLLKFLQETSDIVALSKSLSIQISRKLRPVVTGCARRNKCLAVLARDPGQTLTGPELTDQLIAELGKIPKK